MARIAVIGAGVSGLTCGVVLAERGYQVTVVAKEIQETTSAVAAAIWYPYAIEPQDRVAAWSRRSYETFCELAKDPLTGIDMIELHVYSQLPEPDLPEWAVTVGGRRLSRDELPPRYRSGFAIVVPLIATTDYLPYLRERLARAGASIEQRELAEQDVVALSTTHDMLVNCAGMGAGELFGDDALYAGHGVVLIVDNHGIDRARAYADDPEELAYVIPRRRDCVLGGVDDDRKEPIVTAELKRAIYDRCRDMEPRLPSLTDEALSRVHVKAGLRPKRDTGVRLERQPHGELTVIHNYGHGGAGFTVSWGCAFEVLSYVREAFGSTL
jgi:D-amino-acid oxidase